jgi:hypothetical protein
MKWYHYVTCFVAGVFLIHILPHVLNGLSVKNVVGVLVSLAWVASCFGLAGSRSETYGLLWRLWRVCLQYSSSSRCIRIISITSSSPSTLSRRKQRRDQYWP